MGHTLANCLYHVVFSTKERRPFLPGNEDRIFGYIKGIAENKGAEVLAIDGWVDHVHLLLRVPPKLAVSKVVGDIKGNTSRWISETFPELWAFCWQTGSSIFTVSQSNCGAVANYICSQREKHLTLSTRHEIRRLLQKHNLQDDEIKDDGDPKS